MDTNQNPTVTACFACSSAREALEKALNTIRATQPPAEPQHLYTTMTELVIEEGLSITGGDVKRFAEGFAFMLNMVLAKQKELEQLSGPAFADERNAA